MPSALLVLAGSIASATLVLAGTLIGIALSRRGAVELEQWRRREESLRMLRWASELAVRHDRGERQVGIEALMGLATSPLVNRADARLILRITNAASDVELDA